MGYYEVPPLAIISVMTCNMIMFSGWEVGSRSEWIKGLLSNQLCNSEGVISGV
jgi:hypothetical protein